MKKFKISIDDFEKIENNHNTSEQTDKTESDDETQEKKELKDKIDQISKDYQNTTTRTYGDIEVPIMQEKTYEMPTIEETTQKVTEEIEPTYEAKKQSVESKGEAKTQALEEEKDELIKRVEESLKTLNSTYNSAKESASSQALKRGLARSSIILNQLYDLEKGRANATEEMLGERDKNVADIMAEVERLKDEIDGELNVLTEEKVKKINERVEELVEKYQKEQDDVFEYNNKIRKEKADTIAKLKSAGIDATEENSNEYVQMISDKTKAFYSYYYSLGENAKSELISDKSFVESHLGKKGYEMLMRYFDK